MVRISVGLLDPIPTLSDLVITIIPVLPSRGELNSNLSFAPLYLIAKFSEVAFSLNVISPFGSEFAPAVS